VSCTGTHAAVCPRKGRGPSWQVYLWRADGDRPHGTYYASILADMGVALTEGTLCDAAIRELTGRAA
jgi:hypothetical protein